MRKRLSLQSLNREVLFSKKIGYQQMISLVPCLQRLLVSFSA
jgi:hypothetical protein